jgi:hypothetical protein
MTVTCLIAIFGSVQPDRGYQCATGDDMSATQRLHNLGQSLWLDNITGALLTSGTLNRYNRELAVTGLTSNPTIFDQAIKNNNFYDSAIRTKARALHRGSPRVYARHRATHRCRT